MSETVKILAMHPGMQGLFPNKPGRWEFIERDDEAEIVISASIESLDKQALDRFHNLRMIASISAGFSNVDLDECKSRGIAVTNAPGLNSGDVADLAVTMMTSLLLRFPASQQYILSDQWTAKAGPIRHSIRGMTVGIVGMGSIGQEAAARLAPFGIEVKWWGPRAKPEIAYPYVASLQELAAQSCGLIVCCRPDTSTHKMIDASVLDALGADGVLVNVSRGSVVDEEALIAALKEERLAGAGLDVFDPEPTNSARWGDVPNVILTPHQGGSTYETLFKQAQLAQENIENFVDGKALLTSVY